MNYNILKYNMSHTDLIILKLFEIYLPTRDLEKTGLCANCIYNVQQFFTKSISACKHRELTKISNIHQKYNGT